MAVTQYIGSRYVPILADPVEWSSAKTYEPLTIVTHEGNSYTSRQFVPVGINIANETYWAITGNYNAQIELYRRETTRAVETTREITNEAVSQVNTWLQDAQRQYSAKPFAFDTVADMQAAYALLYEGAICHTNGFHENGDSGAAWYVISDTGIANGMDVLTCGNLFANLVITDAFVTPEMFGAYGDGATNDFNAITKCLPYKNILLNASKTYVIDGQLDIPSNTKIDGGGAAVKCGLQTPFNVSGDNVIIEGLRIYSLRGVNQYGINISTGVKNTKVANIYGEGLQYSLLMNDGIDSNIERIYAYNCGWDCVSNYTSAKNATIRDCIAVMCGRHGFSTDPGADTIKFINCYAEDIGYISGEGHTSFHFEGAINSRIINCKCAYTKNHRMLTETITGIFLGLRVESNRDALYGNVVDGLEIVFGDGFEPTENVYPFYINTNYTKIPTLEIKNLLINNESTNTFSCFLGRMHVNLDTFIINGPITILQESISGQIKTMKNGHVNLGDKNVPFYKAQYLVDGLSCVDVNASNLQYLIWGRLTNCIIKDCAFSDMVAPVYMTQATGDANAKSSNNQFVDNIVNGTDIGIRLGWWTGTQGNIIAKNTFKGTIPTLLKGSICGCYFYENIENNLTYTTALDGVTPTTTPPYLTI